MINTSMKKSVIFIVNGRKGIDLDLKLPLALGFQDRGYEIIFIACASLSNDPSKLNLLSEVLSEKLFKVYTIDKLLGYSRFFTFFYLSFPFKDKYSFANKLIYKFVHFLTYLLYNSLRNKIKSIYKNALFISAITTKDNLFSNQAEKLCYSLARESDILFLGLPTVVWPNFYLNNIYPFDAYFVNSKIEKEILINKLKYKGDIIFEGCPSYDKNYMSSYSSIKKSSKTSNKGVLLFILVNRSNKFNFYVDVINESKLFIKNALESNYKIIVKYHPVDIHNEFEEFRGNQNFVESSESIEKLTGFADASITLLSTAILKSISQNIPSFLFVSEKAKEAYQKNQDFYNSIYFKDTVLLNETWVDDYCNQFNSFSDFENKFRLNDNYKKYRNFIRDFETKDALNRSVEKIIKIANVSKIKL